MSTIVGVRKPGRSHVAFVRLDGQIGPVGPGQSVIVEDESGQFAAAVVIGPAQFHPADRVVHAAGEIISVAPLPSADGRTWSQEDALYRARKATLPALGDAIEADGATGVVIGIDMRDETITVRAPNGELVTIHVSAGEGA